MTKVKSDATQVYATFWSPVHVHVGIYLGIPGMLLPNVCATDVAAKLS